MSIYVNEHRVTAILVGGTWVDIEPGSFVLDAYEFHDASDEHILTSGQDPLTSSVGFRATTESNGTGSPANIVGPLMHLQAVRYTDGD